MDFTYPLNVSRDNGNLESDFRWAENVDFVGNT